MSIDEFKHRSRFAVDTRRKEVAKLVAVGKTETVIAATLGVSQMTISRDIKALREISRQFVFDLAKSDLAYCYKQSIDAIEYALQRASDMIDKGLVPQYELLALQLIKDCAVAKFDLIERGPSVLNARVLEERIDKIVAGGNGGNGSNGNGIAQKQELR